MGGSVCVEKGHAGGQKEGMGVLSWGLSVCGTKGCRGG